MPVSERTTIADIDALRARAEDAPLRERLALLRDILRLTDDLFAIATEIIGRDGLLAATGVPGEALLALEGRRSFGEARTLMNAAEQLRAMPHLTHAFRNGYVSWSQVRAIVWQASRAGAETRERIDAIVASQAYALRDADPDHLVHLIDRECSKERPDLKVAREDRAIERRFLVIQPSLDGRATLYGEGDAVSIATIATALDTIDPESSEADDDSEAPDDHRSPAQRRFDGLLALCERSLAGDDPTRPRARILGTVDLASVDRPGDSLSLLWNIAGGAPRLTNVTARTLMCDAALVPVLTNGGEPIAVGDAYRRLIGKARTAVIARDRGCRFPGCRAPVSRCDAHHVRPGHGSTPADALLLCIRCHRIVHRYGWSIDLGPDGGATFTRGARSFTSRPPP